jgi:hypothetical protein
MYIQLNSFNFDNHIVINIILYILFIKYYSNYKKCITHIYNNLIKFRF